MYLKIGLVKALRWRYRQENNILKERGTSNICTAQVLLAVMAGMYAVYHGRDGIKNIATKINSLANLLKNNLEKIDINVINESYFDTLHIKFPKNKIEKLAIENQINFNYINDEELSISINESTEINDIEAIYDLFKVASKYTTKFNKNFDENNSLNNYKRESEFLEDPIFNTHQSETSMMRYIKKLERKDLSLNHSMISLGSCTMKLNAAAEMLPLSWSNWNNIHPFAPLDQAIGYFKVLNLLEKQLNEVTGFHSTTLQPNSGAQGEYTGLMLIRAYFKSKNQEHRNICLIPASAHGTNPASAIMAGMKVVVVGTDKHGNINENELIEKAQEYSENLAALMITYPSTHGVFESSIQRITEAIHSNGGQVYMDGANMNAQVGLTNPFLIGDVCHLNLHKTFAIPHGGGGPGVGPVCVAEHLAEFLPKSDREKNSKFNIKAISSAPWGSAMACLISYGYIKMMGPDGLRRQQRYQF